ncbi:MAG: hypothetical protein ACHQO8_05830 [Vicinamibacterales bacterium]
MRRADLETDRTGELRLAIAAALLLVLARSFVPLAYEQVAFDSDQAIVGLMAKHLSELRAFPLFFYGQNYMLGVQAWIAAPFVWLGGATVTMIRLPLFVINGAVAALLIAGIARAGLRPWLAFVAVLPFLTTTPVISLALYATLGASVEPFLYLIALWALRQRPLAFGALLCFGALHREFTILALPALAVVHAVERRPVRWRSVALGALGFAAVWLVVDVLTIARHAGSLAQEAETIGRWLSPDAGGYLARTWSLVTVGVPVLFGARRIELDHYSVNSTIATGSMVAAAALAIAALVALARLGWTVSNRDRRARLSGASFLLYLGLVGLMTLAVYGANGRIDPIRVPLLRYVLFGLLVPVAVFGAFLLSERSRVWLTVVTAALAVWAAFTLRDNVLLVREYRSAPPPNEFRVLADYLVAHRIQYGYAMYWDCYVVDFLSQERVILASTDFIRIEAYQRLVDAREKSAASIERMPCTAGARLASWCVDDPLKR